jgi:GAF domain-containing protein
VLWVEDAAEDDRFHDNPLVIGGPRIRSYVGAPISVSGEHVGTVCAISAKPKPFSAEIAEQLRVLAALMADRLELRRQLLFATGLLQGTSDAVLAVDEKRTFTHWNAAAERMFGYTPEEAIGKSLLMLIPERYHAAHDLGWD